MCLFRLSAAAKFIFQKQNECNVQHCSLSQRADELPVNRMKFQIINFFKRTKQSWFFLQDHIIHLLDTPNNVLPSQKISTPRGGTIKQVFYIPLWSVVFSFQKGRCLYSLPKPYPGRWVHHSGGFFLDCAWFEIVFYLMVGVSYADRAFFHENDWVHYLTAIVVFLRTF